MNSVRDNLWDELGNDLERSLNNSIDTYKALIKGYDCTEEEINNNIMDVRKNGWNVFCNLIAEETTDNIILIHLRERFEDLFRYDKAGLPRVWNHNDDIDAIFKKARDESLALISLFTFIDISEQKIRKLTGIEDLQKEDLSIIDEERSKKLLNKFSRDIELQYIDAKRSVVNTQSKIPPWFIILTFILGFNEFVVVLTNPIYFAIAIAIGVSVYALYKTNLLKPVFRVIRVMFEDIWIQIISALRRYQIVKRPVKVENAPSADNVSYYDDEIALTKLNRRKNKTKADFDSNETLVNF